MQRALSASGTDTAARGQAVPARWGPVLGLAGLHGAVSIAWVAYNLYLVELLLRAGFDPYLATVLVTVEGFLGAALEPLMGSLSDRARTGLFRRFFLVLGGVLLAALLFFALPLAAAGARPGPATLVPALLVGWACAMAVFRAPALSLLGSYARPGALPLASSVLTAAAGLVGAAAPPARAWLLSLGLLPTFATASAVLVVTALLVRVLDRREPQAAGGEEAPAPTGRSGSGAAWVLFAVGTSSGLAFRFLTSGLPRAGAGPGVPAAAITTAFFLGLAVAAIPAGRLALGRIGGGPVTMAGACLLVAGSPLLLRVEGAAVFLVAAALGAALAALQNGLFAWCLLAVPARRAGLGMGLLLGAGGLALGLFNVLLAVRKPAPGPSLLAAAGLYALTLVLLTVLRRAVRPTHAA